MQIPKYVPPWPELPLPEVVGYTERTPFYLRWFGYAKYRNRELRKGRFITISYTEAVDD